MADRLRRRHGLECHLPADGPPRRGGRPWPAAWRRPGSRCGIYACGGDGTLHEVANGIAGFDNAAMTCDPRRHGQRLPEKLRPGRREICRRGKPVGRAGLPPGSHRLQRPAVPHHRLLRHRRPDRRQRPPVRRFLLLRPGELPVLCGGELPLQAPSAAAGRVDLDGEVAGGRLCPGVHVQRPVLRRRLHAGAAGPDGRRRAADDPGEKRVQAPTFARLFPAYSAGDCWKLPGDRPGGDGPAGAHRRLPGEEDIVTCLDGEMLPQPGGASALCRTSG